jgi:glycosyltransferase 2 family protein
MTGSAWRWARALAGTAILVAIVTGVGGTTVLDALRATDAASLALGAVIALGTTACAAWRWQVVARRLSVELTMPSAVVACYRAQFLNVTLPGGVVGDVGRGVSHGRAVADVGGGLRAVAWERTCGQVVLAATTVVVLAVTRPLAWPALDLPGWVGVVVVVTVLGGGLLALPRARRLGARIGRSVATDAFVLLEPAASARILLASLVIVAGHVATFVVAARAVGIRLAVVEVVPLALVVLLVAAVPLNVGGWGPREGAAAWTFAAAGLGAAQGLAVAVSYGAIVLVATLPGAALLLVGRGGRARAHG